MITAALLTFTLLSPPDVAAQQLAQYANNGSVSFEEGNLEHVARAEHGLSLHEVNVNTDNYVLMVADTNLDGVCDYGIEMRNGKTTTYSAGSAFDTPELRAQFQRAFERNLGVMMRHCNLYWTCAQK
jgi:hypothetical protein